MALVNNNLSVVIQEWVNAIIFSVNQTLISGDIYLPRRFTLPPFAEIRKVLISCVFLGIMQHRHNTATTGSSFGKKLIQPCGIWEPQVFQWGWMYRRDRSSHVVMRIGLFCLAFIGFIVCLPLEVFASEPRDLIVPLATKDPRAIFCLIIFLLSYLLVMTEEHREQ